MKSGINVGFGEVEGFKNAWEEQALYICQTCLSGCDCLFILVTFILTEFNHCINPFQSKCKLTIYTAVTKKPKTILEEHKFQEDAN